MRLVITKARRKNHRPPEGLSGYISERSKISPSGRVMTWKYSVVIIGPWIEPGLNAGRPRQPLPSTAPRKSVRLKLVARLIPLARLSTRSPDGPLILSSGQKAVEQAENAAILRPVQSGKNYRITSLPVRGLVRPELAKALETVFEQFAVAQGFTAERPLEISLSRGFKANSHGHKEGRAADITSVGGKTLLQWKQSWEAALESARKLTDPQQRSEALVMGQRRNLGYGLYKALQAYGGWRVNPEGWRVYRNVMQLFGPWTVTDGPWKAMRIENPSPQERQRLADQRWVFHAHQDHIHAAR